MNSNDVEKDDPKQAEMDSRIKPRPKGAAPHWYRCTWYKGTRRCLLADGHPNEHEFEPVKVSA